METTKRLANPVWVQELWDAISHQESGQGMDFQRLKTLMVNSSKYQGDNVLLRRELNQAIKDGLLSKRKGNKKTILYGSPPAASFNCRGKHDWYCFRCHSPGKVVECDSCYRVYHKDCLQYRKPENGHLTCPACHLVKTAAKIPVEQGMLNLLLQYICDKFQTWKVPRLDRANALDWALADNRPNCNTMNSISEVWRFNLLVYRPTGLQTLIEKTSQAQYASLEEFQVDCETLVHGLVVYFGQQMLENGQLGERVLSTAMQEIEEIRLCPDCYRRSNGEKGTWWFCSPCTVPHEVVWVKHPDCAYRPAKVMKNNGETYDVWYFGGDHERETVHRRNILNIETTNGQLTVIWTPLWKDAFKELEAFQAFARFPELANEPELRSGGTGGSADTRRGPGKRGASKTPAETVTKKKSFLTTERNSSGTRGTSKKTEAATTAPRTNGNQNSPPTRPSENKVGDTTKWSGLSLDEAKRVSTDPNAAEGDKFVASLVISAAERRMSKENATVNDAECGLEDNTGPSTIPPEPQSRSPQETLGEKPPPAPAKGGQRSSRLGGSGRGRYTARAPASTLQQAKRTRIASNPAGAERIAEPWTLSRSPAAAQRGRESPQASQSPRDEDDDSQVLEEITEKEIDVSHLDPESLAILKQFVGLERDAEVIDLSVEDADSVELPDESLERQDRVSLSGNESHSVRKIIRVNNQVDPGRLSLVVRLAKHFLELESLHAREIAKAKQQECVVVVVE